MRKSRMQMDWVVNDDTYGQNAGIAVPGGTIGAAPLTYPKFIVDASLAGGAALRSDYSFPEGEKQFVKAVVGVINFSVSVWALGSVLSFGLRITKKPIDVIGLGAITDGVYSLADAQFANERFAWQHIVWDTFAAGAAHRTQVRVKATVNQWLEPDEALWLIYDNFATSTVNFNPYLRTLMKADA